ncbi:hypothetical protein WJX75_008110 [Coccomyxa subellipsoidea]|uniref:Uncharacterized protein n=1 Tax=Coccomyxa subellipsoidea TaxID=248742 RepID=A0ABR2Z4S4_9CHLO
MPVQHNPAHRIYTEHTCPPEALANLCILIWTGRLVRQQSTFDVLLAHIHADCRCQMIAVDRREITRLIRPQGSAHAA